MTEAVEGLVLAREGGRFRVLIPQGPVEAVLRGRIKWETGSDGTDKVVVGDRVTLDAGADGMYAITRGRKRQNLLARRLSGTRAVRPIAANLDHVFVLTSAVDPAPVPQLIDRLLVIAEAAEIPASVVVTKTDLDPGVAIQARMRRAGYPVYPVSNTTREGLVPLLDALHAGVNLVTGPSGVGKSTLLNALEPGLTLITGEISEKIRRGKNTTVGAIMVPLSGGGFLVDTPGLSEVGLAGHEPREVASCFPEFRGLLEECRFQDCRHLVEPDCAIRTAVDAGTIDADRYESYVVFRAETEGDARDWE